jgi:hypothetical protein
MLARREILPSSLELGINVSRESATRPIAHHKRNLSFHTILTLKVHNEIMLSSHEIIVQYWNIVIIIIL